jgi:pimeloyl-ACP methyl ester carboxylesterase
MKTSHHLIFCFAVALSVTTTTTINAVDYSSSSVLPSNNLSTKNNLRHHRRDNRNHRRTNEDNNYNDSTASNRRRREREEESSSTTATCSTAISERGMGFLDIKRSAIAARLSSLIYELDEDPYYDSTTSTSKSLSSDYLIEYGFMNNQGTYYESKSTVDAAYTVQINNEYCAVVFRGTTFSRNIGSWIEDLWSNLIVDPIEYNNSNTDESDEDGDSDSGDDELFCDIHRGYYEAYFDFEYINEIETFLDSCHNDCPECEILLTGHSQGGSIAEVAGLYLKDRFSASTTTTTTTTTNTITVKKSPYVITFGSPQALGSDCSDLFTEEERCNWYHYILAIEGNIGPFGRGLVYDPFPMLYPQFLDDDDIDIDEDEDTYARNKGLAFIGHEIFISSNDPTSILYGAFNDHRPVGIGAYGGISTAHNDNVYADVLEELLFGGGDGDGDNDNNDGDDAYFIPTSGFSVGSVCNLDDDDDDDDDDDTCADGLECKKVGWWMLGPQDSCQPIDE